MPTATAKKVAASGFGSTPSKGRTAVTRAPLPPPAKVAVKVAAKKAAKNAPAPRPSAAGGPAGGASVRPAPRKASPHDRPSGRSPDYRAPKLGGSKNVKIRLGSRGAQKILLAELLACLLIVVLSDVMNTGGIDTLAVSGSAVAGLFLLLALLSAAGQSGERIAVGFGGLVVLGTAVRRWQVLPALSNRITSGSKASADTFGVGYLGKASDLIGPPVTSPVPPPHLRVGP